MGSAKQVGEGDAHDIKINYVREHCVDPYIAARRQVGVLMTPGFTVLPTLSDGVASLVVFATAAAAATKTIQRQ